MLTLIFCVDPENCDLLLLLIIIIKIHTPPTKWGMQDQRTRVRNVFSAAFEETQTPYFRFKTDMANTREELDAIGGVAVFKCEIFEGFSPTEMCSTASRK